MDQFFAIICLIADIHIFEKAHNWWKVPEIQIIRAKLIHNGSNYQNYHYKGEKLLIVQVPNKPVQGAIFYKN